MKNGKNIIGFEGKYLINDNGDIYSLLTKRMLKKQMGTNGYHAVALCKDGKAKTYPIHRLVAINLVPNPNNYNVVNHLNGDKTDNSVSNLEWCTYSENNRHAIANGFKKAPPTKTGLFGASHNRSKTIYEFSSTGELLNTYGSGLEFQRRTGNNHSTPSWAIKNKKMALGKYYSRTPIIDLKDFK